MPKTPPQEFPPDWPATRQSPWAIPLSRAVMFLFSRLHLEGTEHIPEPPYIIVANHLTYFDIPAMLHVCPPGVVGMAARKYQGTWKEPFFRLNALIWVTQFSADRQALRASIHVLEHGAVLAIAPEGTRSKTGGLIEGREGIAFVATRANVPIVPAALWGVEKILKRPRPRVTIRVGRPFRLPETRAKGEQLHDYTDRVMCAIAALLPEQYHGVYAGHPLIEEMAQIVR